MTNSSDEATDEHAGDLNKHRRHSQRIILWCKHARNTYWQRY